MRRWRRGYNSCSRTDLEFLPVVSTRRRDDSRQSATATVKSCQSSIMSTGGHFAPRHAASSAATAAPLSIVRDSRRLDSTKSRSGDYMEASSFQC